MAAEIHSSPSPGPLYSPRSPILRKLLIALVALVVIIHEGFSWMFKSRAVCGSLPEDGTDKCLARNTLR